MGEFSFSELIVIVIIAIVIYGKDLPQAARKLATMYNKLRRQLTDIKDEIHRQIPMDEIQNSLKVDMPDPMAPQIEIPMTPSGIMAQVSDRDKALVTWNSVPGALTYNLKRSTSSSDPLLIVGMGLTDLSYTDGGLEPGKTYHYVVSAQNSAGESGSSEEAIVTLAAEAGGAPAPAAEAPPAPAPAPVTEAPPPPPPANGAPQEPVAKADPPAA